MTLSRAICLSTFLLLGSCIQVVAQTSGIISGGLSHNINWMPEPEAFDVFRSSNSSGASSLASLGSEVILGYEMFAGAPLPDSTRQFGLYLQAGYLQRGYRVGITSGSECLSSDGYHVRSAFLRLALLGRNHIALARGTSLVLQFGGSYGQLLSVSDNVAEVQFCDVPIDDPGSVMPKSFIEAGGGVGIQRRVGPHLVGIADLLFFYPLVVSASETRPAAEGNVRSLIVDVATPNLAITLGVGWVF